MSRLSKRLVYALIALVVYAALLVGLWAARPLHDSVPVGIDYSPTVLTPPGPQRLVSQEVECNTLFDSAARDDAPLPELTAQPKGRPDLAYQRTPCALVHRDARLLFGLDLLAVAAAIAVVALVWRRVRRHEDPLLAPA
jgi:hypothetical protein